MKLTTKNTLAAAAIAGLLTGSAATSFASQGANHNQAGIQVTMDDKGTHSCKGKNACKGKGGCKTDANECKGHNTCKGKGGCATDGSKH
jgi:hypothetical protein